MGKTIWANIRLSLSDLAIELGLAAGLWLLIELGTNLVVGLGHESSTVLVAAPALLVVGGVLLLVINGVRFGMEFPRGVRFSVTRRRMLAGTLAVCALHTVAVLGLSALLGLVSDWLYRQIWQPRGVELALGGMSMMPWWVWPAVTAACVLGGMVGGALHLRFGAKAMWALWAAWMVFVFFDDQVIGFVNGLLGLPSMGWLSGAAGPVALAGCAVLVALSVRWLLRLTVREG